MSIVREWERLQTVDVASNDWSGGVHLVWLIAFVAACGTGGSVSEPDSTAGSTEFSNNTPAQRTTTISPPAESTGPSTSLSRTAPTSTRSRTAPTVLQSFVETWNQIAAAEGRGDWMIDPWLPLRPPSSPENTYGLQVSLGGDPPQLVVDAVASGERLVNVEVAVLRWDESSVELIEDAFRIGVMTALVTDDPSHVDGIVAELVEQAMLSPTDQTEMVELPGGAVAGSFSTDVVYVLGIRWDAD